MITLGKKAQKEEFAYILDYLPYGRTDDNRPMYQKKPLAQGIGEKHFVLIEMMTKENAFPNSHDRVYIGEGDRHVIDHVKRRIIFSELTNSAQMELPSVIEKIILSDEKRFLNFFNDAYPITTRLHMLELLPGIGKKLMWAIIEERKKGKFENIAQLVSRVKGLHTPEKLLMNRILEELKDENIKYRVFTTPMPPKR
jgi:putative nucleotide binding protein